MKPIFCSVQLFDLKNKSGRCREKRRPLPPSCAPQGAVMLPRKATWGTQTGFSQCRGKRVGFYFNPACRWIRKFQNIQFLLTLTEVLQGLICYNNITRTHQPRGQNFGCRSQLLKWPQACHPEALPAGSLVALWHNETAHWCQRGHISKSDFHTTLGPLERKPDPPASPILTHQQGGVSWSQGCTRPGGLIGWDGPSSHSADHTHPGTWCYVDN